MSQPPARFVRLVSSLVLCLAALLPSATPAVAADPVVLRVGTLQDLDLLNPFNTALLTGYEAFTLNYDLLVGFGADLEPVPGFAESWSQAPGAEAGTFTWTFKIRSGMTWSDGKPATAADARWTLQFVLDAVNAGSSVGLGYLDPDLAAAGVTKVEAPDPTTLVVTTNDPTNRVLQMYIPILPEHLWKGQTLDTVPTFGNEAPVVGSGPYQAVEWQTGRYVRFVRNPDYWGPRGAADEVVIQIFGSDDLMTQALKAGEIDYAHGVNANEFNDLRRQPDIATVAGTLNGWTMLSLNCYAKDIPGGGASTSALRDAAFRDALGYAIDKDLLVARVLGGYGTAGTTQVPPFHTRWHVEPDRPRTFDIDLARSKLAEAGYPLDGAGKRLDKDGKPIRLRLDIANDSPAYANAGAFIKEWFGMLGIEVTTSIYDAATLYDKLLSPEAGDGYVADWDMVIWGWTGYADPNPLLKIFTTEAIGNTSDSLWSNPAYDQLFEQQSKASSDAERHALMAQLQNLFYDQAPYHVLFYDDVLDAYRTDRFAGWQNQPANGVPFFEYGSLAYTLLTPAAEATPAPAASGASAPGNTAAPGGSASAVDGASAAPTAPGSTGASDAGGTGIAIVVAAGAAGLAVVAILLFRRRRRTADEDEGE